MNMKAKDLHQFSMQIIGSGSYRVTYHTEARGDYWVAETNNSQLIDDTFHADWAKLGDIKFLRYLIKRDGVHYNQYGQIIERAKLWRN